MKSRVITSIVVLFACFAMPLLAAQPVAKTPQAAPVPAGEKRPNASRDAR